MTKTSIVEKICDVTRANIPHCAIQLRAGELMTSTRVAVVVAAVLRMGRGKSGLSQTVLTDFVFIHI